MKRKQHAVFPLAAKVLLPQHESPSMCFHILEADCLSEMGGRGREDAGWEL